MAELRALLLGTPRIEQDGGPFEVDTRKATALLAYLALTGEAQSRDTLANLLWPDHDTASARGALRRTLSSLRGALSNGAWLLSDRDTIDIDRSALWSDVSRFQQLYAECQAHGHPAGDACDRCLPLLAEAASLYRGDFLSGFSLRDSFEFEDWQSLQADLLRRQLTSVLERLVRAQISLGQHDAAIQQARRWLSLDPLQEAAHRQLMQLYAWAGDRSAALRQYRDCVRILSEELDVSPLDETRELYEAIVADQAVPPKPPAAASLAVTSLHDRPGSPRIGVPFLGREAELAALLALHESLGSSGHFAVIEGEAGIGKSRLVEEAVASIEQRGCRVLQARCYEGESALAYGPIIEFLRGALALTETAPSRLKPNATIEAARLLPDMLPAGAATAGPLDGPGALGRFLTGLCDVLTDAVGLRGVLIIEDLQWADEASLDLLTFLVRRLEGRPVLLLGTWRREDVAVNHRLRQLVSESMQRGYGSRIGLERLRSPDVQRIVEGSGLNLPAGFVGRLYEETEGVPFFIIQFVQAAARGLLSDDREGWTVPEGGQALLQSRLSVISQQGLQLLAAAAVIGRSFSFEIVRDVSGRGEDETLATLEELLRSGVIRELAAADAGASEFDFSHEKLRSLVYEQSSLARRRLLHRRVAEALERGRSRDSMPNAAKIAAHYRQAGDDVAAAVYFRRAGDYAVGLHAHAEALRHYQDALALGAEQVSDIYEAIGELQVLAGDYPAAMSSLERAAATVGQDSLYRVEQKLGRVYHRLGEWSMASQHFASGLEELGEQGDAGARARLLADWSLTSHANDQSERAAEMAAKALDLAEAADDDKALAQAHNLLGVIAGSRGDFADAEAHLGRSLAIAETLGDAAAQIAATNNLALTYRRSGKLVEATTLTRRALVLSTVDGDRHREAALRNNLADLLQAQGDTEGAMDQLKQAVTIFAEIGAAAGDLQPEIWKLVEW